MRGVGIALLFIFSAMLVEARGSVDTVGDNGIRSAGLTLPDGTPLDGTGALIGQVEGARPSLPNFDTVSKSTIKPTKVFIQAQSGASIKDTGINDHAERVAGIMISTQPQRIGVAPKALLYSSAYVGSPLTGDDAVLVSMQAVAMEAVGPVNVRAINLSFGKTVPSGDTTDGNSNFTLGVDWIATKFDVLPVVAGNEGTTAPLPTDNFNGITVAASAKEADGVYRRVANLNTYGVSDEVVGNGDRYATSLIAPGQDVTAEDFSANGSLVSGTSYAAPMVSGTVALLQQYANDRLNKNALGWTEFARRHEGHEGSPHELRRQDHRQWNIHDSGQNFARPYWVSVGNESNRDRSVGSELAPVRSV
jgi:subtilisin family serine protease